MLNRTMILFVVGALAFLTSLSLDVPVARWVHDSGMGQRVEGKWWAQVLKEPGQFRFTLLVAIVLLLARIIHPRQAIFVVLASAISGLHVFLKWLVGRTRPYKLPGFVQPSPFELNPFRDGVYGFFHQTNLSFPSGHVCPATALMASMFLVWPKGRWIFVVLTVIVGIERIAENAHYCSDVIGAIGFAMITTMMVHKVLKGWMTPPERGVFEVVL